MFFPPINIFFTFTYTIFLEQQGLNLITFFSWELFYKKSRLHRNWNHLIWMSKTQLMTQTLRLYQNQNRFRNSTSRIFWAQQGLNLLTLPSWELFEKNFSLPRNWNHSIWMSKTKLMTQTLRLYQNQNRFQNSIFRIFWAQQGLNFITLSS